MPISRTVFRICLFVLSILCFASINPTMAQKKIKLIKNPVSWSYTIAPKTPLKKDLTTYDIHIDSHLNPMDWWDDVSWNAQVTITNSEEKERLYQEAITDTLNTWSNKHIALKWPYRQKSTDPDFKITLKTLEYKVESVQQEVDFSDMESGICEVLATARLTVINRKEDALLDTVLTFYVDEESKSTVLPIRHFMLNPVFKMKYNLKKKPEKKRKLLNRKLKKYEADVLEYFFVKSGKILRNQFLEQERNVFAATFGVKNKGHEALNDASSSAKKAINALSALSKKKKKNLKDVQTEMEIALSYWQDKLERTTATEIRKLLCANLSLGNLILGNVEEAKKCFEEIPGHDELRKKALFEGNFQYYLRGLSEAIAMKEQYGDLVEIR